MKAQTGTKTPQGRINIGATRETPDPAVTAVVRGMGWDRFMAALSRPDRDEHTGRWREKPNGGPCRLDDCEEIEFARGLCYAHYRQDYNARRRAEREAMRARWEEKRCSARS